ncbi:MAG: hypothetical protein ABI175_11385, partial [Polyangiales bacterium]
MRTALVCAIVLLLEGCATGGADETTTRADTAHPEDADEAVDTSSNDAFIDATAPDTRDSATSDSSLPDGTVSDTLPVDSSAPPDTFVADTPDTSVADAAVVVDTATPDTLVADTL